MPWILIHIYFLASSIRILKGENENDKHSNKTRKKEIIILTLSPLDENCIRKEREESFTASEWERF